MPTMRPDFTRSGLSRLHPHRVPHRKGRRMTPVLALLGLIICASIAGLIWLVNDIDAWCDRIGDWSRDELDE